MQVIKYDHETTFEDDFSHNKKGNRIKEGNICDKRLKSNCQVEGEDSVATTMQGAQGRSSKLYIIGDYLFCNAKIVSNRVQTKCRNSRQCRRYAYLEPQTLKVIKFTGEHFCIRDPDLKFQIQMENEMKELAAASAQGSKAKFREIYDTVCKKNPTAASRITFSRIYKSMVGWWRQANSNTNNQM